jgi:hypothetical protein
MGTLTRLHALIVALLVGSPTTLFFAAYAIRSVLSHPHRLDSILRPGKRAQRALVLSAVVVWLAFLGYSLMPSHLASFAQPTCERYSMTVQYMFLVPGLILMHTVYSSPGGAITYLTPFVLIATAWAVALWIHRKTIWPPGTPRWQFWRAWYAAVNVSTVREY